MTIELAGKVPAERDALHEASQDPFKSHELYLERQHLSDVSETLDIVEDSEVTVTSVHTPHVPIEEPQWLQSADDLAYELGAYLVVHSNRIIHTFTDDLEAMGFQSEYGYESNPGISERHIRSMILDRGHEFVLDTAHLYMAEKAYIESIERLLREFGESIPLVHFCDSTLTNDGLAFGEGTMDMEAVAQVLQQEFSGTVVLEVMPEDQIAAKSKVETYWDR